MRCSIAAISPLANVSDVHVSSEFGFTSAVPDDELTTVWQGVLDLAEAEAIPVTSTLIRKYVKELNAEDADGGRPPSQA